MSLQNRKHVEGYLDAIERGDAIAIIWQIDDIISMAESGYDKTLGDEDARNILWTIDRRHDASIGVSWDVIEVYLDDFFAEQGE